MNRLSTRTCLACVFACILLTVVSRPCGAVCRERPTVMMDERTASSHLLAKRDVELPASKAWFDEVQKVTLVVTVDRRGSICDLRPIAGPRELRKTALKAVKGHWRFRPFLVDWKPVVGEFPVTVRFVPPRRPPPRWLIARTCGSERLSGLHA